MELFEVPRHVSPVTKNSVRADSILPQNSPSGWSVLAGRPSSRAGRRPGCSWQRLLYAIAIDPYLGTWQYAFVISDLEVGFKALASDKRLQILAWLKDPTAHFRPQIDGDLVKDGVCGQLITEKLGVSQPTASEHLRILVDAGFLTGKRLKQWVFFRRDEPAIAAFLKAARIEV